MDPAGFDDSDDVTEGEDNGMKSIIIYLFSAINWYFFV